jgi:twitching motility protein PilT
VSNGQVNQGNGYQPEAFAFNDQLGAAPAAPASLSGAHAAPGPSAPVMKNPAVGAPAPASVPRTELSPKVPNQPRAAAGVVDTSKQPAHLTDMLAEMLDLGASDLHLSSGAHPTVRLKGELEPLEQFPKLEREQLQLMIYSILTQKQRDKFEAELELDLAYALPGRSRFRVNIYRQRESVGAAFRVIPYEIKPLEDLGVPPSVGNFAGLPRGMVLVTGPTGSGKSTTLASLIDLANRTRAGHIMTVEDPIEFLHRHKKSLINQREVGEDTHSFASALKHVLRQDPDIILVGEMRDLETISVALTAAETGHLVFATLHTQDAAQTIDRVIDVFPPEQQQQVRVMLSGSLQGVVCQTLCKTADGRGRAVATEVLIATPAIRNLIREGKTHQIYSSMQAGAQHGMHTMDQHLAELVRTNRITYEQGLEKCHHVEDFKRLTGRI